MRREKVVNSNLDEKAAVELAIQESRKKKAAGGAFFSVAVDLCPTYLPPLLCSMFSPLPTDTTGVRPPIALCFALCLAPTSITTYPTNPPPLLTCHVALTSVTLTYLINTTIDTFDLRNYPLSGEGNRRKDGGFVIACLTPTWWPEEKRSKPVGAVVLGYSPTTTNNDNTRKPRTLQSRNKDKAAWGKVFHGNPDSAMLEWCSDPYETVEAAEELRDKFNTAKITVADIDIWYLDGVEQRV